MTIFAALLVLSVLLYLLMGGNPLRRNVIIRSYVTDSGGMSRGSPVRLNGLPIGKVESVGLAPEPRGNRIVEIRMSVEAAAAARLPEDSIVEIGAENLLGDKLIAITAGRSDRPVAPGGELRYQPPAEIDRAQVIASFDRNLRLIDRLLDDIESGRGSLARFIRDDALYESARTRLQQFESSLSGLRSTGQLSELLRKDDVHRSIEATIARYDTLLADLEGGRGAAGEFLRSSRQHEDMLRRIASLRGQIARIRKNRFLRTDEDYERWNREIERLMAAIDKLNFGDGSLARLLHTAHTYESLAGASQNLQEGLRQFQRDPRKFLRIDLNLF
jgi:phospholipid/cholesterol/gamma-HCH transport system substrate-binding protein